MLINYRGNIGGYRYFLLKNKIILLSFKYNRFNDLNKTI